VVFASERDQFDTNSHIYKTVVTFTRFYCGTVRTGTMNCSVKLQDFWTS